MRVESFPLPSWTAPAPLLPQLGERRVAGASSPLPGSDADRLDLSRDGLGRAAALDQEPLPALDEVFNLSGRVVGRLFGLERRVEPAALRKSLAAVGQLLQSGVVGYEVRRLRNGEPYLSFLSVEVAPGGPYGRPYPPGHPRARLER